MNATTIIVVFVILAVVSLIAVSFVNRQLTRRRVIASRVHALRRRIIELEEIASGIEPLLEDLMIPKLVNDEVISIIETILRLDPNAIYVVPIKEATLAASESLAQGKRNYPLNRALTSDAAIAKHQFYLKETANIVRKQHTLGTIDTAALDEYIKAINWGAIMTETISHIGQGHIAMDQSNVLKAFSYYKRAQQILSAANVSDPRRDLMIRELSEMLANNRRSMSASLMPETHLNPKNNPHEVPASDNDQANEA